MRLKTKKKNKSCNVIARCNEEDKNTILRKALIYTEGNVSEWMIYAATEFVPDKDDFEKKKGGK